MARINKKIENVILIESNLEKLTCLITVIVEDNTLLDAIVSITENSVKKNGKKKTKIKYISKNVI